MKTTHFFILGALLLVLGSCNEQMQMSSVYESIETMHTYCSYNYREGDTVVFSMDLGHRDTYFVVERVKQTTNIENICSSSPTNKVYATSSVEMRDISGDYRIALNLSLTYRLDKPLDVNFYISSANYEGIDSVCCQSNLMDKITVSYRNPKSKGLDSYLMLRRGIGLIQFGNEHDHIWKYWQEALIANGR